MSFGSISNGSSSKTHFPNFFPPIFPFAFTFLSLQLFPIPSSRTLFSFFFATAAKQQHERKRRREFCFKRNLEQCQDDDGVVDGRGGGEAECELVNEFCRPRKFSNYFCAMTRLTLECGFSCSCNVGKLGRKLLVPRQRNCIILENFEFSHIFN